MLKKILVQPEVKDEKTLELKDDKSNLSI